MTWAERVAIVAVIIAVSSVISGWLLAQSNLEDEG